MNTNKSSSTSSKAHNTARPRKPPAGKRGEELLKARAELDSSKKKKKQHTEGIVPDGEISQPDNAYALLVACPGGHLKTKCSSAVTLTHLCMLLSVFLFF